MCGPTMNRRAGVLVKEGFTVLALYQETIVVAKRIWWMPGAFGDYSVGGADSVRVGWGFRIIQR